MQQQISNDPVIVHRENDRTTLPDIKLSQSGYLIYANARGIDFLRKVSEYKKTSSVGFLMREFPMMMIPGCKTTLHLKIEATTFDIRVTSYRLTNQVGLFISRQLLPVNNETSVKLITN